MLVGGLVGSNLGSIFDSAASTTAVAVGKKGGQAIAAAGGLAGRSDGTIGSSFATGNASITGRAAATYYVGGLVGLGIERRRRREDDLETARHWRSETMLG